MQRLFTNQKKMPKTNAILIFDIGKTNKKVLLFDQNLKILVEEETRFPEITDDDGFPAMISKNLNHGLTRPWKNTCIILNSKCLQ
jgi:predicted NBD/HSP70 family sugar kinase